MALSFFLLIIITPFRVSCLLRIDITPRDQTIVDNSPLTLHCHATSSDDIPVSYTWYRGNSLLVNGNSSYHKIFPNGSLHYARLPSESIDSFQFTCRVNHKSGSLLTSAATITFAHLDDYPSQARSDDVTSVNGGTAFLQCPTPFPSGLPSPRLIWLKDGFPVPAANFLNLGSFSKNLQIPNATVSSQGSYQCQFFNDLLNKSTTSPSVRLTVGPTTKKLHLLGDGDSQTAVLGESVLFECIPFSRTAATVKWSREANATLPTGRFTVIGTNLKLTNITRDDEGEYECAASASPTEMSYKYFTLTVDEIPTVTVIPAKAALNRFLPYSLKCSVYGKPTP